MPFGIRKHTRKHCYTVYNIKSRKIHAKCTSKSRAEKQLKLLRAIVYGKFKPTRRNSSPSRRVTARIRRK
jgi:hypothetical protein